MIVNSKEAVIVQPVAAPSRGRGKTETLLKLTIGRPKSSKDSVANPDGKDVAVEVKKKKKKMGLRD